jgi:hypothetical protein
VHGVCGGRKTIANTKLDLFLFGNRSLDHTNDWPHATRQAGVYDWPIGQHTCGRRMQLITVVWTAGRCAPDVPLYNAPSRRVRAPCPALVFAAISGSLSLSHLLSFAYQIQEAVVKHRRSETAERLVTPLLAPRWLALHPR